MVRDDITASAIALAQSYVTDAYTQHTMQLDNSSCKFCLNQTQVAACIQLFLKSAKPVDTHMTHEGMSAKVMSNAAWSPEAAQELHSTLLQHDDHPA